MQDEEQLVRRAQQDPTQFAYLYDRYAERIYAYAQREVRDQALAQDIVSATFEKALRNLPRYRWRGTSFGAWLYKIARNEIRMHYRKSKWVLPLIGRFFSSHNVEQTVQQQEQIDHITRALQKLSARDQELIRLYFYEDLSHAEMGEILNKSAGTTAVALHRALKRLRRKVAHLTQEVLHDVTI